jgi:hypothetical protein
MPIERNVGGPSVNGGCVTDLERWVLRDRTRKGGVPNNGVPKYRQLPGDRHYWGRAIPSFFIRD